MRKGKVFNFILIVFTFIVLIRGLFLGTIYVIEDYFNKGEVPVPDFVGMSVNDAFKTAEKSKLKLIIKGEMFDDFIEKDRVTRQDPYANARVKKGRIIDLFLSKGKKQNITPNTINLKLNEAENLILSNNFSLGKKSYIFSPIEKDRIISQNPSPGIDSREGQFVHFLISNGQAKEFVILPDFLGGNYVKVKDILLMLGLNVGTVKYDYDESKEAGEILMQDPVSGKRLEKGSEVNLKVNKFAGNRKSYINNKKNIDFVYQIPEGIIEKELKVILIDDMGIREVHRKKYEPGYDVSFKITGRGKMKALIYIDNLKIDEAEF